MGKMGAANRVTEKRYNTIKAEAKSPKDDERLKKKHGVGSSTMQRIRNTDNFYEYRRKTTSGKLSREHLQVNLLELEGKPKATISSVTKAADEISTNHTKGVLDDYPLEFEEIRGETMRVLVFTIIVLGTVLFIMGGTVIFIMGSK